MNCTICGDAKKVLVVEYDGEGNAIETWEPCSCVGKEEQPKQKKINKDDPFGFEDNNKWLADNWLFCFIFCFFVFM